MPNFRYCIFLINIALMGCSHTLQTPPSADLSLLHLPEPRHVPSHGLPTVGDIFALPDEAKAMLDQKFSAYRRDPLQRVNAFRRWMAKPNGFRVDYDNATTYLAAESYAEQAGNCMSLAILTVAFARHLELQADFIKPDVPLFWEQRENLEAINDHINVMVQPSLRSMHFSSNMGFMIDFSVGNPLQHAKSNQISEQEAISYFYRNRSAEALANEDLDLAYSYAYQVMNLLPKRADSYSLIGLVLRRQNQSELAQQVYELGMLYDDEHPVLLHNLAILYRSQGMVQQAVPLEKRLDSLRMTSPFVTARKADQEYELGHFELALNLYNKALRQADYVHDFHFCKAKTLFALGEYRLAQRSFEKALELSTTRQQGYVYSRKIALLEQHL